MIRYLPAAITCLMLPLAVLAEDSQSTDKCGYTLFNPTPSDQLRPLTSEAYDGVFDARTLDAGHYQAEGEFINYYHYSSQVNPSLAAFHYTTDQYSWAPRFTVGLLNNVDFYVRPTYEIRSFREEGFNRATGLPLSISGSSSGFGYLTTGIKVNLWGNDEGTTALALKPYFSIPTEGGDLLGGSDVVLLVRLPQGFYLKFDSEFYATENINLTHYVGFNNSMSINKILCSKTEAYWYLDSTVTSNPVEHWYGYTGFGLKYNFTSNMQLFAGIGFGLTSAAYDYNPRLGFVWRL